MNKLEHLIILALVTIVLGTGLFISFSRHSKKTLSVARSPSVPTIDPLLSPVITATPTTKTMSFAEMNAKYGPCAQVPVLMYHHIQSEESAKKQNQQSLSVEPKYLRMHLQYLHDHGYSVITPSTLINFFDNGQSLPSKPVLITLDDAYVDNYTEALPIFKEFHDPAVIFVPTGLVNNPDYLSWDQLSEMKSSGLYLANHTWSHHASAGTLEVLKKEISLADTQLSEHGQNPDKVFAYPYGKPSASAEKILSDLNYKLAFTTTHGSLQCKGQRFFLPRIRVGNAPLSSYGL